MTPLVTTSLRRTAKLDSRRADRSLAVSALRANLGFKRKILTLVRVGLVPFLVCFPGSRRFLSKQKRKR